ncbi:MAG: argininosuccinate lyase [Planctomycetota bacterium]|jgi:argininosuccinate lyase/amino-acid N-acetyltransferase
MALWGGRFAGEADPRFKAFNDSLRFDARLASADVTGSIAWAAALHRAGVLEAEEHARLAGALGELGAAIAAGDLDPASGTDEDIHPCVERELVARVGALGKKLHTGRSRNDQVATDLRLWLREAIDGLRQGLAEVQRSLVVLAERERETVIPGYTHLQRAQPVLMAHWCLAWVEMFERDRERLADARRRVNRSPLGAAALAGTAWPIDREQLAADLGFEAVLVNSLDAVSDRDLVIETMAALATIAIHGSRLAEDLIFQASGEAGFVEPDDSMSSGSSIMPQKKNPDALELVRGKSGPVIGALVSLLVTMKGLPLAYNKDMQEDKEPLFIAVDAILGCLSVLPPTIEGLRVDRERTRAAAEGGHANATELADWLAARGVPFRDAHEITGLVVRRALERGVRIQDLELAELQGFHAAFDETVYDALSLETLLAKRDAVGGTSPRRVAEQLERWRQRLATA